MPNPSSPPNDMDDPTLMRLRIGDWCVDPRAGQISRAGETVRVEARGMRLLLCLATRAGSVVSIDELLDHVWSGVIVTPDSVYQAITSLRRQLGDDPKRPTYIATVPRLGYRMVAAVSPWGDESLPSAATTPVAQAVATPRIAAVTPGRSSTAPRIGVALILVLSAAVLIYGKRAAPAIDAAQPPAPSIAVLPFLDLTTQAMNEEYVADGMTEELIGDLSKLPDFRVPGPTSSFYFKDKPTPVAEIAKKLGVVYVLDGSIRKSDGTVRVAARLIRAQDGYVAWTETYDRPEGDILKIQKDIAAEMSGSVHAAIAKASLGSH
ncbi:winged helix-turn-helix domain-containing protein [Rhodanobacter sp. L36]|uniref:winged helix-turn-helix domain-containing protein n=1 Tax=Rhodanobacter sp. L36 TaxID=1747221 RepID=UPI0020B11D0C|nr:winged helix-turn-helix domain-containing protein [Rhodanobacter sp. L36]